ncbi:MAG: hypothetical protein PVH75_11855 [Syntrophobacterales bacterium]|jgi:hypothetical protein
MICKGYGIGYGRKVLRTMVAPKVKHLTIIPPIQMSGSRQKDGKRHLQINRLAVVIGFGKDLKENGADGTEKEENTVRNEGPIGMIGDIQTDTLIPQDNREL